MMSLWKRKRLLRKNLAKDNIIYAKNITLLMKGDYVTAQVIRKLLDQTVEYIHIKELAAQDIEKKLKDSIEKFLEERNKIVPEEVRRIVIDASKVRDQNINDIIDAFVKMRSQSTLEEMDAKSINDILLLFSQWIKMGSLAQPEAEIEATQQGFSLEEQVLAIAPPPRTDELYPTEIMRGLYQPQSGNYESMGPAVQFITGQGHDNPYMSRALYKIH
jgi:hypothetical protein